MKGFLIGNPYTMEMTDFEDSMVEFGFSHALIGLKTYYKYLNECPHLPQKEIFLYGYQDPANYTFDPVIQEGNIPMKYVYNALQYNSSSEPYDEGDDSYIKKEEEFKQMKNRIRKKHKIFYLFIIMEMILI